MINVEFHIYHDEGVAVRQMKLTEDGFVELRKLCAEDQVGVVCKLMKLDVNCVHKVEVLRTEDEKN